MLLGGRISQQLLAKHILLGHTMKYAVPLSGVTGSQDSSLLFFAIFGAQQSLLSDRKDLSVWTVWSVKRCLALECFVDDVSKVVPSAVCSAMVAITACANNQVSDRVGDIQYFSFSHQNPMLLKWMYSTNKYRVCAQNSYSSVPKCNFQTHKILIGINTHLEY